MFINIYMNNLFCKENFESDMGIISLHQDRPSMWRDVGKAIILNDSK